MDCTKNKIFMKYNKIDVNKVFIQLKSKKKQITLNWIFLIKRVLDHSDGNAAANPGDEDPMLAEVNAGPMAMLMQRSQSTSAQSRKRHIAREQELEDGELRDEVGEFLRILLNIQASESKCVSTATANSTFTGKEGKGTDAVAPTLNSVPASPGQRTCFAATTRVSFIF